MPSGSTPGRTAASAFFSGVRSPFQCRKSEARQSEAFTESGVSDTLIVIVNLDPHSVRETTVHLDLTRFGLEPGDTFPVTELLSGAEWTWGEHHYVRLDAFTEPVHILSIQHGGI